MTRRSRRRGQESAPARAPRGPSRPPRRSKRLRVAVAGLAVALAVLAGWMVRGLPRGHAPRPAAAPAIAPEAARESLEARAERRDWEGLVALGERLLPERAGDVPALLVLSKWWQNLGRAQRRAGDRVRPATRTSLEHLACERRSLLLADSAYRLAADVAQRAQACGRRAEILAGLDLNGEALLAYREALENDPRSAEFAMRVQAYEAFLRDPMHAHAVALPRGAPP